VRRQSSQSTSIFKKGNDKYENQNERQGGSRWHNRRYQCRWRDLAINTYFHRKEKMKIRTEIKAGTRRTEEEHNHNQTVARGLKVKTNVKACYISAQHNHTMARGLKVKTGIKAGQADTPIIRD
jgi:hypothetical protein